MIRVLGVRMEIIGEIRGGYCVITRVQYNILTTTYGGRQATVEPPWKTDQSLPVHLY